MNWTQKTIEVKAITDRLSAEYDIDKACGGEVYETVKAMMALAINEAVNALGGTPRKKRRIVTKMANWLTTGNRITLILMFCARSGSDTV